MTLYDGSLVSWRSFLRATTSLNRWARASSRGRHFFAEANGAEQAAVEPPATTTSKYAKFTKCSADTALRDIRELLELGVLLMNPGRGRSTSYRLV